MVRRRSSRKRKKSSAAFGVFVFLLVVLAACAAAAAWFVFLPAGPQSETFVEIAPGDVYTLAVTIPEGATRFDIAARVVQAGFLNITKESFLAATVSETPLI